VRGALDAKSRPSQPARENRARMAATTAASALAEKSETGEGPRRTASTPANARRITVKRMFRQSFKAHWPLQETVQREDKGAK